MKRLSYILLLSIALAGCTTNPPQPQSLIVEGWIDADGYPTVLIHKSYVFAGADTAATTIEEIAEDLLIPVGKVVVSDGEDEVILTGRLDTAYLPPYTYSSLNMVGQVGKQYTVTVTYKDFYATATTTIPPIAHLDSICVRSATDRMDVRAFMRIDEADADSYYALFARKYGTKQFRFCPLCVFEGTDANNGILEMKVTNPVSDSEELYGLNYYFKKDSAIPDSLQEYQLKIARIDYTSYQFWKAYNEQVVTSGILFVPVYKNVPSNVSGGWGYFSGMGSSMYRFNTAKDTTYQFGGW